MYFNANTGILSATAFNNLSDENLKKNVVGLQDGLSIINNIRPVEFEWKDSGLKSYGVIAQEIEKIIPDLVQTGTNKSVNYDGIIAFLIKAVQELSEKVDKNNE